jgi:hypothetical protein
MVAVRTAGSAGTDLIDGPCAVAGPGDGTGKGADAAGWAGEAHEHGQH